MDLCSLLTKKVIWVLEEAVVALRGACATCSGYLCRVLHRDTMSVFISTLVQI